MRKLLLLPIVLICSTAHADILGNLTNTADVLLTTQAVAGGGGGSLTVTRSSTVLSQSISTINYTTDMNVSVIGGTVSVSPNRQVFVDYSSMSVAALNPSTFTTHASRHQDGGADEVAVTAGMLNAGTGATAHTYWSGDNTWKSSSTFAANGGTVAASAIQSGSLGASVMASSAAASVIQAGLTAGTNITLVSEGNGVTISAAGGGGGGGGAISVARSSTVIAQNTISTINYTSDMNISVVGGTVSIAPSRLVFVDYSSMSVSKVEISTFNTHTHGASTLDTDSVSADELNATGVETELEAVLDLDQLQGTISDAQIAAGAVDGGNGGEIADGSITADDLGTDSVSADELNATGVETELEAVLDLDQLQGQIADAQLADGSVDGGSGGEIADASVTADDLGADSVSASELNAAGVRDELEAVLQHHDIGGNLPGGATSYLNWPSTGIINANHGITSTHTVTGGTVTASTTLVIPNGANPDVSASGELALDTTANQLALRNGSAAFVVGQATKTWTLAISSGIGFYGSTIPFACAPPNSAITITSIDAASLPAGTTVQYKFEERAFGSAANNGSNIFSAPYSTANATGVMTTVFNDASIAANACLYLVQTATDTTHGSNPFSFYSRVNWIYQRQ